MNTTNEQAGNRNEDQLRNQQENTQKTQQGTANETREETQQRWKDEDAKRTGQPTEEDIKRIQRENNENPNTAKPPQEQGNK
jgi:hypothetical protein